MEMLILSVAFALLAVLTAMLWYRYKTRRTLQTLDAMLESAINGTFAESAFDESLLSAVEAKLAGYLAASAVSAHNLQAEKEKIAALIADVSHQTKTPVANLLLYAQLLAEQDLPPDSRVCVQALTVQAEKLAFLIEALVKSSRLETGILTLTPGPASVGALLAQAAEQIAPRAETKGVAFAWTPCAAAAFFDPKWTAEALFNLLDNAVKYTPPGGAVSLSAVAYDVFCRIDVTDTGPGIAEEEQAKIFGRFYRSAAAASQEGVGLGLYLARQIAAGQGGYIRVASVPGQGSSFSLFLPREA